MSFRTLGLVGSIFLLSACGSDDPVAEEDGPIAVGEPSVILYDQQPMVVDVELDLARSATLHVELAEDPGARSETVSASGAATARVRVRGLAPDQDFSGELVVEAGGKQERLPFVFQTRAALDGFEASFEVTGNAAPGFRLFDQTITPGIVNAAIFTTDTAGTTRFYLPSPGDGSQDVHLRPPAGVKLEDDGIVTYVQNGRLLRVDELGELVVDLPGEDVGVDGFHHDALRLPNGNLLVLGHEFGQFPDPKDGQLTDVAGDVIVELTPAGEKVWEWSSFAHLDTQRVPGQDYYTGLITSPTGAKAHDWSHGNGMAYSEADDSILLSLRHQDWVLKIDHATGDVLWRLGPGGDFTLTSGTWFYHQHSPAWTADGSLLLYDNGAGNPDLPNTEERSRPVRYELDEASLTATQLWDDTTERYMSLIAGDADELENGNILVLDSTLPFDPNQPFMPYSRVREVDPATNTWVWTMQSQANRFIYRTLATDRLPGEAVE